MAQLLNWDPKQGYLPSLALQLLAGGVVRPVESGVASVKVHLSHEPAQIQREGT